LCDHEDIMPFTDASRLGVRTSSDD